MFPNEICPGVLSDAGAFCGISYWADVRNAETIKIYATVNKEANLRAGTAAERFGKNRGSGQIRQSLPPVRGCVWLWRRGWHPGAFGTLWAVWGLCGRRLTREFCEGISRGKTAWEAVPEQQFCGSNPAISAGRKKYKIKGGGR